MSRNYLDIPKVCPTILPWVHTCRAVPHMSHTGWLARSANIHWGYLIFRRAPQQEECSVAPGLRIFYCNSAHTYCAPIIELSNLTDIDVTDGDKFQNINAPEVCVAGVRE